MEYVMLGQSNLRVSRICLGCMGFGNPKAGQRSWTVSENGARVIVGRVIDAGVNFFDTAIAIHATKTAIEAQLEELELAHDFISYKCWFYDVTAGSGTCDTPRNMSAEELPDDIRRIKAKCRINRY